MYRKGTIILPVLIVLSSISLLLAGGLFYLYQKEHAQNIQLQEQLADLGQRQKLTEGKLEDAKKTASELTLRLQETNSKVDSLNNELAQEKSAFSDASNKIEQFKADLQQQQSVRQDLEKRLKAAFDEGKQIKEQVRILQQQKTELEGKIKELEAGPEGVELGKVIVASEVVDDDVGKGKPQGSKEKTAAKPKEGKKSAKAAVIEGKVMIVNKEFNFAVINLGSRDNINIGDEFAVSREGKYIGDLKVEKVHDSMSAAGFSPELKDFIKENDKITQKAK